MLHLGKFFPPDVGGMETCLADLVAAQRSQGGEVFALVHGQALRDDPPWLARVPVQARLMYAPIALGYRRALARAIERFEPDLLHLHMPNNSVFWALTLPAARRLPWVVHWHSDVLFEEKRLALQLAYRLYRPFETAVLSRARRVVATSPAYLAASAPLSHWRAKCSVVPLGLKPRQAVEGLPPPRAGHAWSEGRLRVLSIGRLAHYKGFDTLMRAACGLAQVELLIAGDGEQRDELQSLAAALAADAAAPGRVRLLGAVGEQEKHALLASCDVFALASRERTEAFGMVLLEAMSHGKPCLASDLPGSGMPWVVGSSGAGQLVEPGNVDAWRAALLAAATQPRQLDAWGRAGRSAFEERFSADASAKALHQEYLGALDARPPSPRRDGALLIVIPARNEARTIGEVLARLRAAGYRDVVVVDDLSHDGTGDIARGQGAKVLRPVLGLGAWGGMQTGIRYGLRHGYRTVITMDADGQHEVDEIPTLLAASRVGPSPPDVIIGAHPERASRMRHVAWSWFRWLTGLPVTDLTSGFRCYHARALPILASSQATLLDYQDVGTLLLLRSAGLRVVETPVSMNARVDGISRIFHSWPSVARYMAVTTLLCVSNWGRAKGPRETGA